MFLSEDSVNDVLTVLFHLSAISWRLHVSTQLALSYTVEDLMREAGVELLPLRKKNSLRPVPPYMIYLQHAIRKIVETTGSLIPFGIHTPPLAA